MHHSGHLALPGHGQLEPFQTRFLTLQHLATCSAGSTAAFGGLLAHFYAALNNMASYYAPVRGSTRFQGTPQKLLVSTVIGKLL